MCLGVTLCHLSAFLILPGFTTNLLNLIFLHLTEVLVLVKSLHIKGKLLIHYTGKFELTF